jgi:hypothetical protein
MDRRTRRSFSSSFCHHLCLEPLEGRVLLSTSPSIDALPGAHSNLPPRDGGPGNHGFLELRQEDGIKQPAGAPAGFNSSILDQLFSAGEQAYPAGLAALADADAHRSGQDHDDPVAEILERQEWGMLSAASQASQGTHSAEEESAQEGGEASENSNGQLIQERPVQITGPNATTLPTLLASVVSAVETPARPVLAPHPQLVDDLNTDAAVVSEAEKFSIPSERAEALLAASTRPAIFSNSLPLTPLSGAPVSGFLRFDMEALAQGVDKLVDELANMGRSWSDPWRRLEIAFWLATVTAAMFEVARLHARKSPCRSVLENSARYGLADGMEPEL